MPLTKSAKKALRVADRRHEANTKVRSQMKTAITSFMAKPGMENLSTAFSCVDKAVKNHLLHRNTAARRKARLARLLPKA
jgi:small subunit ribosomal protein S20